MADHGVKAAIRASAAWPEYTGLPHETLTPAQVLEALNDRATSKYSDLSGCFLCVDLEVSADDNVSVRFAQAGESPMVIVDQNGWHDVEPASGFIMGLFPEMHYEDVEFSLQRGERLFMFTDGLTPKPTTEVRRFGRRPPT